MNAYARPGETDAIKSVPDPGPDSLAETVDNIAANVVQAARREQRAKDAFAALRPGDVREPAFQGWITQAKHEQAHWREYLGVYREWLAAHPELADLPTGTKCAHRNGCRLGFVMATRAAPVLERIPGIEDDLDEVMPPPHWTDREAPDVA